MADAICDGLHMDVKLHSAISRRTDRFTIASTVLSHCSA